MFPDGFSQQQALTIENSLKQQRTINHLRSN
jgi:hypothetical protein